MPTAGPFCPESRPRPPWGWVTPSLLQQRPVSAPHLVKGWMCVLAAALVAAMASGCATRHADGPPPDRPPPAAWAERDGPDPHPPADLERVPDAEPRIEPVPAGGPNKPYDALGQTYTPLRDDRPLTERGLATWYGRKFHGRRTSSGEPYDMYAMTAAHATLPIPSYARVRNPANHREVVVRINDRGPFHSGRIIDLSYTAALKLGVLRGATAVEVERITAQDIRTGAWRHPEMAVAAVAAPGAVVAMASNATVPTASGVSGPVGAQTPMPTPTPTPSAPVSLPGPLAESPMEFDAPEAGKVSTSGVAPGLALLVPVAQTMTLAEVGVPGSLPPAVVSAGSAASGSAIVAVASPSFVVSEPPMVVSPVSAPAAPALPAPSHGYWLQLGAFRESAGAAALRHRVEAAANWLAPQLWLSVRDSLYRLQAGPYESRAAASTAAERVRRALNLSPMLVEER